MCGRILIVEDSDENRFLREAFLKNTGLNFDFRRMVKKL